MEQNVVVISFAEESKVYQALSELKAVAGAGQVVVQNAAVIERGIDGLFTVKDGASDGSVASAPVTGTLIGSLVGLLAGPLGALLGAAYGALLGSAVSADKATDNASVLDQMISTMPPGSTSLIATVGESDHAALDALALKLGGVLLRRPLAVVQDEVEAEQEAAIAAAKEARKVLRDKRKAEWHGKFDNWKTEVGDGVDKLKASIKGAFSSKK